MEEATDFGTGDGTMGIKGELNRANLQQRGYRSSRGSGIVMSVAGLILIVAIIVGASQLILNIGLAAYYKDKLDYVARQAAAHAAGELFWAGAPRQGATLDGARAKTVPLVQSLLQEIGLPAVADSDIVVSADDETATVTFPVKGIAAGVALPVFLDLTASGLKAFQEDSPPRVVVLSVDLSQKTMVAVPALSGQFNVGFGNLITQTFSNRIESRPVRPINNTGINTTGNFFSTFKP